VGIAAINAVENGSPTTIALPTLFADSTDPTSALNYSVTDDTNPFLFSSTVIDSSGLTLNYGLNAIGSGSLTLTATDSGGLKVGASSPSPFAHHG
jgi:hypothetical protein